MFAQFRTQYPQGSIKTKMLDKADGLHVFRATIKHGEVVLSTATAADTDIEVAEDRAIKRALMIAGVSFESNYGMKATLLPQLSQQMPDSMAIAASPQHSKSELSSSQITPQLTAQSTSNSYPEEQLDFTSYEPPDYEEPEPYYLEPKSQPHSQPSIAPKVPEFTPEPLDLSDAQAQILVEMERLSWTVSQGREYLLENYKKKSRNELTPSEIKQFLSYLKSLPTPYRG